MFLCFVNPIQGGNLWFQPSTYTIQDSKRGKLPIESTSVSDPYHFVADPDPDPRIRFRDDGSGSNSIFFFLNLFCIRFKTHNNVFYFFYFELIIRVY